MQGGRGEEIRERKMVIFLGKQFLLKKKKTNPYYFKKAKSNCSTFLFQKLKRDDSCCYIALA